LKAEEEDPEVREEAPRARHKEAEAEKENDKELRQKVHFWRDYDKDRSGSLSIPRQRQVLARRRPLA
jgi:hypothetical protein